MTSFCSQNGNDGNQGFPRENNANIIHITSLLIVIRDETWEAGGSQAELQGWGCGPWPVITQLCHREPVCPNPCYRAQLGLVLTNLTVLQNNSSSKLRLFGRKGSVFWETSEVVTFFFLRTEQWIVQTCHFPPVTVLWNLLLEGLPWHFTSNLKPHRLCFWRWNKKLIFWGYVCVCVFILNNASKLSNLLFCM